MSCGAEVLDGMLKKSSLRAMGRFDGKEILLELDKGWKMGRFALSLVKLGNCELCFEAKESQPSRVTYVLKENHC